MQMHLRILAVLFAWLVPHSAMASEWVQVAIKDVTNTVIFTADVDNADTATFPVSWTFSGHHVDVTRTTTSMGTEYCFTFTALGALEEVHCLVMATGVQAAHITSDDSYVIALAASNDSGNAPPLLGKGGALGDHSPGSKQSAGGGGGSGGSGGGQPYGECCGTYNGVQKCTENYCPDGDYHCDVANCNPPCLTCRGW